MIFLIAMGADYSFYVKTIETHARAFFKIIIFSIGSVNTLSRIELLCTENAGTQWTIVLYLKK